MTWIEKAGKRVPVALTIAGSDSGGGAGVQADLKTFAALGVHGTSAITSITAQSTTEVRDVMDVTEDLIDKQISVVAEDMGIDAAKTGMLHTSAIIRRVYESISHHRFPTVVDPVMVAKSGADLLKEEAVDTFQNRMLPLATVLTPNKLEAEKLTGTSISSLKDARRAARVISEMGPRAVVVKGGHMNERGYAVDVLLYEGEVREYRSPRLDRTTTHGTGCSFSAAIAGCLARGMTIPDSVERAKRLVWQAVRHGVEVGRGHGPVNPLAELYGEALKYHLLTSLERALEKMNERREISELMPEVRMNLVYALPEASELEDVMSFPGRITFDGENLAATARPRFGASHHLAQEVIEVMKQYPELRSALNIRYDRVLVGTARNLGLNVGFYDRRLEPTEKREVEGATIPWGVSQALAEMPVEPDLIYHTGDLGKEPMIVMLGKNPAEAVEKTLLILESLGESKE